MNFPTLQSLRSLACSPTRSRRSPLPEGAFWGVRTLQKFPAGATIGRPLVRQRLTSRIRRGGVSPPACRKFYPAFRRRTDEPALCKGRCRAERGGGVVSDKLSSFFPANFTPLQSLRRCRASPLYTRGLWVCANIAKTFCFCRVRVCPRICPVDRLITAIPAPSTLSSPTTALPGIKNFFQGLTKLFPSAIINTFAGVV